MNVKAGSDQKSFIEAAKEIGVYRDGMKREDINKAVLKYFNALCGGMDEYFKADIFITERQEIEHDRKECSNMKCKRLFADNAKREGKLKDANEKRQHKKLLMLEEIYLQYTLTPENKNIEIRCGCNNSQIVDWGINQFIRHVKTKGHLKWENVRDTTGILQSTLLRVEKEKEEKECLKLAGTCDCRTDHEFRESVTKAMLTTGISINKVDALRTWLEHETKKSIGPADKLLSTYVKDLLKSEIAQQKEELANSAIAIIFDATPRIGDFFAMVARRIDLNSEIKRAITKQTLFHCSAIQGSLNGDTLMGEVTRGLGKRGLSHSNAAVTMNDGDGCYTNGAAHDKMKSVSDDAGDDGISPRTSAKLLNLLLDERKNFQLQVEMAAYHVEALFDLWNLCYYLEGDGTDLPFKVAGRIQAFKEMYSNGQMKKLPATNALVMRAIACHHINRPRRIAAINAVRVATLAGETNVQRQRREAQEAAAQTAADAAQEEARVTALEAEIKAQALRPPLSKSDWDGAHIIAGVAPSIQYPLARIANEKGDRFEVVEFFYDARLFDPTYAKDIDRQEAMLLLDKMRCYHVLDQDEDNIIDQLKNGC
eukprot:scaffold119902_cov40-Attheya_sp.AAC.1